MFKKIAEKSIQYDLLRIIIIALLISTIVLSAVLAITESTIHKKSLMTKGQGLASLLAKLSQEHVLVKDEVQLDSIVHDAIKDDDVVYTVIYDARGNNLSTLYASIDFSSPRLKDILAKLPRESELPEYIAAIKKEEPILEVTVPITVDIKIIGTVTVGMSTYSVRQLVMQTVLSVFLLNAVLAIVLGIALFYSVNKKILAPIVGLSHAADRLAQGDLSTRVTLRSTGEAQNLIDSFNRMAGDLEKTTVSKNYVNDIISSMRDALIVATPLGNISRINIATSFLLGYDETELIGQPISKVILDDPGSASTTLMTILNDTSISTVEKIYIDKSGVKIPVLFSAAVMRDTESHIQGIVCVAQNITALKKAEQKLQTYSDELEKINEELKSFAHIVSHDLRAPLVNIRGFSEELIYGIKEIGPLLDKYLSDFEPNEREKFSAVLHKDIPEALNYIASSVMRMDNLITAILKLSRAGRRTLNPELLSTRDMVQNIFSSLTHQIGKGNIRASADGLPDISADRTALEQIFGNLIDNAIKYLVPGRAGEITVSAEQEVEETVFHVRDNGRGMAAEDIPRAFEIFRRVGKQDVPGEGMGLAYVKTLVRLLGGRIWCDSAPGTGTTFSFSIPRTEAAAVDAGRVQEVR